jgi:hypothetical protein
MYLTNQVRAQEKMSLSITIWLLLPTVLHYNPLSTNRKLPKYIQKHAASPGTFFQTLISSERPPYGDQRDAANDVTLLRK